MPTLDEVYELVQKIEKQLSELVISANQITTADLGSISDNLGLQIAGEVRYGRGTPDLDFKGLRVYKQGIELYDSDGKIALAILSDSNAIGGVGEALDRGDVMIGSNDTDKQNLLYDATAKTLQFRIDNEELAAAPAGWTEISSFTDSWANYDTATYEGAAYFKDPFGIIHLKGLLKNGTAAGDSTGSVFTLPAGYRPNLVTHLAARGNAGLCGVDVQPGGDVRFTSGTTSDWCSLSGLSFPVST